MMVIRVICPNGHTLKVDQKFAGRKGVCPACKAKVQIPIPGDSGMDEDAILDVLGSGVSSETPSSFAASKEDLPVHQEPRHQEDDPTDDSTLKGGSSLMQRATRRCPMCQKDISPKYTICPHCRTFLAESSDVRTGASIKCPTCGVPSFPGADVCNQCGTQLIVRET